MQDDTWLSAQFPFPLVRTNMEGVYTTPAPPDHLNFETASSAAAAQYGLLLHRPKRGDSAAVISAWKRITEKGLRILAPILEPLPEPVRRPRGSPGRWPNGPQALSTNWCGCVLEGAGNWSSVVGTFRLPYLNAPYGVQASECAGLSAWVGLDGWKAAPLELLQTIMNFNLDASTNPPSAFFNYPTWQWWIPDPNDPNASSYFGGGTVMNAPAMKSGDLVQLSCAYATGLDGSPWGHVSFLFYNDQSNGSPVLMNFMFPGPPTVAGQGGSIEWIMENEAATNNQSDTIVPVFSATPNSITPITFTQAAGSSQSGSVIGNPLDGFTVLWEDSTGRRATSRRCPSRRKRSPFFTKAKFRRRSTAPNWCKVSR